MSPPAALLSPVSSPVVSRVPDRVRLAGVGAELGELAGGSLTGASDAEVLDRVTAAFGLRARVEALLLAAVGEVEAGTWPGSGGV